MNRTSLYLKDKTISIRYNYKTNVVKWGINSHFKAGSVLCLWFLPYPFTWILLINKTKQKIKPLLSVLCLDEQNDLNSQSYFGSFMLLLAQGNTHIYFNLTLTLHFKVVLNQFINALILYKQSVLLNDWR